MEGFASFVKGIFGLAILIGLFKPNALYFKWFSSRKKVVVAGLLGAILLAWIFPTPDKTGEPEKTEETALQPEQAQQPPSKSAQPEENTQASAPKPEGVSDIALQQLLEKMYELKLPTRPDFPFTVSQFRTRFKQARENLLSPPYELRIATKKTIKQMHSYKLSTDEKAEWFFVANVTKETNAVYALTYVRIIIKDTKEKAGRQFYFDALASIMAIENDFSPDNAMKRLNDMKFKTVVSEGVSSTTVAKNIEYKASFYKETQAVLLSAKPIEAIPL